MLGWWLAAAAPAEPVVLPASAHEIAFESDAGGEIDEALREMGTGAYGSAARRLSALADAGGGARVRYLEALAWYEGGDVHLAAEAVEAGLDEAGSAAEGDLLALRGLCLADLGRGTDALASLDRAAKGAPPERLARVEVNRALVHLDRGDVDAAEAALVRAEPLAAGDEALLARIAADRAVAATLRGGSGGSDPLARLGDALSRGDVAAAKALVPAAPKDARAEVLAALAQGTIARAEGRFADAQKALGRAADQAASHGLVREQAAALAQLGVTAGADNRWDVALATLDRAIGLVSGTSFRVLERSFRGEAARAAAEAGQLGRAKEELVAARALAVRDAAGDAALAEVEGVVAAKSGDERGASAAYERAIAAHESRGAWADAARVATLRVQLVAADPSALPAARQRALGAFASAHDPLGPVHVGIAEGLGRAAHEDLDGALRTFADAAKTAEGVGGTRGQALARIAKENAAKSLADLADSASVLQQAGQWGLTELVQKAEAYERARGAYDRARADYDAGRYDAAVTGFDAAVRELEALGEAGYARVARRGRAWARFNASTRAAPAAAFPIYQQLVEEGSMLGDGELRVRSMGAAALAAQELGRPEAPVSLDAAAKAAEAMGLRPLAGQCWAGLVEVAPDLASKVAAARRAMALRDGDRTGVYAVYSAAVAAYEAEDYALAASLAGEVVAVAGDLKPAVQEVLDAARQSSSP